MIVLVWKKQAGQKRKWILRDCNQIRFYKANPCQFKLNEISLNCLPKIGIQNGCLNKLSLLFFSFGKLARSAGSLVEEQRALATIGRTWFVHSDDAASTNEVEECLLESQKAYLKSLSVCDKLREYVSEKELLEMRSRLYLNLGLTYDTQNDSTRAKSFMEKALIIAR